MIYNLPRPIPSNYSYDALRIENIQYDGTQYTADVFGVVNGEPMPLIFTVPGGLHRVSKWTITDEEIDTVLAANPEITERLQAAMKRAMELLYAALNG